MATSPAKRAYDANPARVAPFVVNQVDLHTHSPQIIMGRSFNFSTDTWLTSLSPLRQVCPQASGCDTKTADEQKMVHHWKFLTTGNQRQSIAMTSGNVYPMQLQSLNGLVPYAWFGLENSLTGAGLYTFQG